LATNPCKKPASTNAPITTCRTRKTNKLNWPEAQRKQVARSCCGGAHVGVVLAPRLALLGEAAAGDASRRHPSCNTSERSAALGSRSPPLRLLPRTLAGCRCGGAVDCFVLLVASSVSAPGHGWGEVNTNALDCRR
jgi:hypothetical protein